MANVVAIVGPTASGKSALALEAATRLGAEIVNADALQAYRGLDVGTAKPSIEERERVRHHLVDILDPAERYSAGDFARRASVAIEEILERGSRALVVGGSGLYLRALFAGIAPIPPIPSSVREQIAADLDRLGLAALREQLERIDPDTARRLAPGDTQRTARALEVFRATGRPFSEWIRERPKPGAWRASWIGLTLPRALLYDRVAARVRRMVEAGWPAEVRALLSAGVPRSAPALQAIGYLDWIRHFDGEFGFEATVERIERATRRYAKRQQTWFRREPSVRWMDPREREEVLRAIADGFGG